MAGDLHTHTTASDGTLSPAELVSLAVTKGLQAVAITDHDTVDGLNEAINAAKNKQVVVIPGVELSTEWEDNDVHILGFFIDWQKDSFLEFLEAMRKARNSRNQKMIDRLRHMGYDITMSQVEKIASGETIGRPHIAKALMSKGYVFSVEDAFKTLLKRGQPGYVPRAKIMPEEAIRVILEAGGLPVLAHPGLSKVDHIIPSLVDSGLQGLEVYYPQHDARDTKRYREIAAKYNLLVTGGSDFHGYEDNHADLGECQVSATELRELAYRAGRTLFK